MAKIKTNKKEAMQKILDSAEIDRLLGTIENLDNQVRAEVLSTLSKRLDINAKNASLGRIRKIIQGSDAEIKEWVASSIMESYVAGANLAYADLRSLKVTPENPEVVLEKFTADKLRRIDLFSVHKDAVNALVADTYLDFANGMNGLIKGAEHQLNDALKRQTRARMITGQITGEAIATVARDVKNILGEQGFSVLIDKGGRKWTLKQYANMLTRTHIIKSANEGTLNRIVEFGVDIVQISSHGNVPDELCLSQEGLIFSISGKSKKYDRLTMFPPYHPNCRHTYLPRPELEPVD